MTKAILTILALMPMLLSLGGRSDAAPEDLKTMMASPVDLTIYSSDRKLVIGHARYTIKETSKNVVLRGDTRYLNGESDWEHVVLEQVADNPLPEVRSFQANYLGADGSADLIEKADFATGKASCHWNSQLHASPYEDQLEFPPDTYAGATAVIPLQYALQKGEQTVHFHVFDCAPKPSIFAMDAKLESGEAHWHFYPGDLAQVGLTPDLGLLNLLAKPFIPTISVWFDPQGGWQYVGALKDRFYKGRQQILVRNTPAQERAIGVSDQTAGTVVDPAR
jgi:hypothetical protein